MINECAVIFFDCKYCKLILNQSHTIISFPPLLNFHRFLSTKWRFVFHIQCSFPSSFRTFILLFISFVFIRHQSDTFSTLHILRNVWTLLAFSYNSFTLRYGMDFVYLLFFFSINGIANAKKPINVWTKFQRLITHAPLFCVFTRAPLPLFATLRWVETCQNLLATKMWNEIVFYWIIIFSYQIVRRSQFQVFQWISMRYGQLIDA